MNLINVLISILTLFIIGIVGYYARKREILGEAAVNSLPRFLLEVTSPCLIVSSMQIPFSLEKLNDLKVTFVIAIAIYILSAIIALMIPKLLKIKKAEDKGVYQFMSIFSNVAFIGFPVLLSIYSSEAIFYGSIFLLPFNFLVFTVGIYLMHSKFKQFDLKILLNPNLVAVFIGFILFCFSIKIPRIIFEPIAILGGLTTPLSMIFIGASLSNVDIRKIFLKWRLYVISVIRLVIIPIIVLFVLKNIIDNPMIIGVSVIISGMPVAANCAIIAKQYGSNSDLASEGIFITSLLSIVTIPFLVYILSII